MPNELHLGLFPGLNLNRNEAGEWSLGLGLSPQSETVVPLGSPETFLPPQARTWMSQMGAPLARIGSSLFSPPATAPEADTQNRLNVLLDSVRTKEASLSAAVSALEPRSGILRGNERALQRLTQDFRDFPETASNDEGPAPLDTPELVAARDRLQDFRDLRVLVERIAEGSGDKRPLVIAAQVQERLLNNDPDGALDLARAERRDYPGTDGVTPLVTALESAKRRQAAVVVLQACNAAVTFEASNRSEYRAGILHDAVAPGIARFQNQVETTERPLPELITELYDSSPLFSPVLRERGFSQLENLIANDGSFRELDATSVSFQDQFETSTSEHYRQFLFDLTGLFAQSNDAFLKNVATVISYTIGGRLTINVTGAILPSVMASTESVIARRLAGFTINTVTNAAALPVILHQNQLTWQSFKREFADNLAFSASMSLVPHLPGVASHAASIGGMTAYTYATDPNARDVNPLLALAYQAGQHLLGRLGHVTPETVATEMDRTRIAQAWISERMGQGLDALARAVLPVGQPILGMAIGAAGDGSVPSVSRMPVLLSFGNLRAMAERTITALFDSLAPVGRTGMDRAREHILNNLLDEIVPKLERFRDTANRRGESVNDRQIVDLISTHVLRAMRANWTTSTFGLVGETVAPHEILQRLDTIEQTAQARARTELPRLRESVAASNAPTAVAAFAPAGLGIDSLTHGVQILMNNISEAVQQHPVAAIVIGLGLVVAAAVATRGRFQGAGRGVAPVRVEPAPLEETGPVLRHAHEDLLNPAYEGQPPVRRLLSDVSRPGGSQPVRVETYDLGEGNLVLRCRTGERNQAVAWLRQRLAFHGIEVTGGRTENGVFRIQSEGETLTIGIVERAPATARPGSRLSPEAVLARLAAPFLTLDTRTRDGNVVRGRTFAETPLNASYDPVEDALTVRTSTSADVSRAIIFLEGRARALGLTMRRTQASPQNNAFSYEIRGQEGQTLMTARFEQSSDIVDEIEESSTQVDLPQDLLTEE